ncbi:MAG: alpha/beta hydrolase [Bacteroidota bacterium]
MFALIEQKFGKLGKNYSNMRNVTPVDAVVDRPSLFWLFTEFSRAAAEMGFFIPYRKWIACKDIGDQHPVLVLPGFMASDRSTKPLRKFLQQSGYNAYGWDLGRNTAKVEFLDILLDKLESIYELEGQKVSLIGWSLGGVFARQMAKSNPEMVRQVITLGSPFKGVNQPNNIAWLYNLISGGKRVREVDPVLLEDLPLPPPVPTTAIYTKEDGIVPWQLCMEEETDIHQNIQVRGSHTGLGVNPTVLEIIADRLLYKQSNWEYFQEDNVIKDLLFYPSL